MIGVDEVGRGAIAGPLLVCALRLINDIDGLKDSKLLSRKQRQEFSEIIKKKAKYGLGWVSPKYIDEKGLSQALKLGAKKALDQLHAEMNEEIILDGKYNYLPKKYKNVKVIIKADETVPVVSAASIIAKVERDTFMSGLKQHEHYGFCTNVGYCTQEHLKAINKHGYCLLHRKSFNISENAWQKYDKIG